MPEFIFGRLQLVTVGLPNLFIHSCIFFGKKN